jgi:hypothetical protein
MKGGTMKKLLLALVVCVIATQVEARTMEEQILAYYDRVLTELKKQGFEGPFGEEVAKMALIRQIHEDGPQREHSKSIVGMIPGGVNKEVVGSLVLRLGKPNSEGLLLKRLKAKDGQSTYGIYGTRANVVSVVAIALVWEKYVNKFSCFKPEEVWAWNISKLISRNIARGTASPKAKVMFRTRLVEPRKRALKKANRIFGVRAAKHIERQVKRMAPLFNLLKPRHLVAKKSWAVAAGQSSLRRTSPRTRQVSSSTADSTVTKIAGWLNRWGTSLTSPWIAGPIDGR